MRASPGGVSAFYFINSFRLGHDRCGFISEIFRQKVSASLR
jgi:hypothetical protein